MATVRVNQFEEDHAAFLLIRSVKDQSPAIISYLVYIITCSECELPLSRDTRLAAASLSGGLPTDLRLQMYPLALKSEHHLQKFPR